MRGKVPRSAAFFRNTSLVFVVLVLLGALLMVSAEVPRFKPGQELLKEFGIVIFSVFGVSLIYEIRVAEAHFAKFHDMLARKIEQGENTAAACARLGVNEVFDTREGYEQSYRVTVIAAETSKSSRLRFVGRSLLLLIAKADFIKTALREGATVELCGLAPDVSQSVLDSIPDGCTREDIVASIAKFNELRSFVENERPPGSLVFKHHSISLFDSYARFRIKDSQDFCIWDVSFGFDIQKKRIVVLDPAKGLGADLDARHEIIWRKAALYYQYPTHADAQNTISRPQAASTSST